ncbi:MobF family relaxase [Nocardioides sp. InS609-2]|uniref:MobF family relaxase n=1 Tax=Nocardioides sp. InS609-2 TaxID=2760705 RepID=UPI0020BF9B40|nr:MobF family relaxase [Nocardioides sp. InS609-2]
MKVYRGAAAAARHYVEADRSRADDYYLTEGSGVAMRMVAAPDGIEHRHDMDGETYEQWVAGYDIETGAAKGRLRTDDQAVRFVEVTVNGPKTWSLAAALHPEVAAAYDTAQMEAAEEIVGWLASHATTRVGPRGRQMQVPVEQIEAAVVRHFTSRAGDPHRHLHLQINARVFAEGNWRGIHTVGVRDSLEAINGIGHAAVMTNPAFRAALAAHGLTLDPEAGEVAELTPYAGAFSARARQIETNIDSYEARWRSEHPGEEPGPVLRQAWDRRAWPDARPDKIVPTSGEELRQRWVEELRELDFRHAASGGGSTTELKAGVLDRHAVVDLALVRLGARRSAWNAADARGEVERLLAATGDVIEGMVRRELAEDLTARVVAASRPLLGRPDVPEHVRALTSADVLAIEREIVDRITQRAEAKDITIVEGAAGAGKTTRLAATRDRVHAAGHRMVVVTPTRKAAQIAEGALGASSYSAAWLLHQQGFRWDDDGRWSRVAASPDVAARTRPGDVLVVDEAGMLDQDTARALLHLADETQARLILVGDRHQLPAVGRGGVLDLAVRYAPDRVTQLDTVRRFADPAFAELSLRMRTGEKPGEVFDELVCRGEIVVHASDVERQQKLAVRTTYGELVVADTREQVTKINGLAHQVRKAVGEVTDEVVSASGERIGIGDKIATRRNDRDTDVANRETWTVLACDNGALAVRGDSGKRVLPPDYVRQHVELAYATTAYGAQGSTVPVSHVLIGDHTGAASAYVGMTRGRERNVAHLVAESVKDARTQWIDVFGRDRADLGPAHAAGAAAEAIDRHGPNAPGRPTMRRPAPRRHEDDFGYRPPASSAGPSLRL